VGHIAGAGTDGHATDPPGVDHLKAAEELGGARYIGDLGLRRLVLPERTAALPSIAEVEG
jgi:hypothetical protein